MNAKSLKILMVSAEVAPFAKTGGLADVASSLSIALALKKHDVRIAMPRYREISEEMTYVADFPVQMDRVETCIVKQSKMHIKISRKSAEVPVYYLENHHFYDRDGIYCYVDDGLRFAFLCKAVLEMIAHIDFVPDIIHCNDWHTGPITFLLKAQYSHLPMYENIKTVFTIHNLQYQGTFSPDLLKSLGIDYPYFTPDQLEFYGKFNFMKTGLLYADIINTVSKTYAEEILTKEFGEQLEGVLEKRKNDLYGIVNGIGDEHFSPKNDPYLLKNYSIKNIEVKKEIKEELQQRAGLEVSDTQLIGLVHRLVDQKGLDLIIEAMQEVIPNEGVQFIVLGLGDPYYIKKFKELAKQFPKQVKCYFEFNEALAHLIYAGIDVFLMPSRFEPCGLGQMIAQAYGTIPIVRATGGLLDTVEDFDGEKGSGFSFRDYTTRAFKDTLMRAVRLYKEQPDVWESLKLQAMAIDNTWTNRADEYVELYKKCFTKKA
ncbi:MAG: glycogen synthase [Hyphomonadaceae bacterium]|nr:glycogen synthase [Clostridia bacterium]